MAQSSCDDSAIYYVLPILWMASCFYILMLIEWLICSNNRWATYHPLPERYCLPAAISEWFDWMVWREWLYYRCGDKVCHLQLPCCLCIADLYHGLVACYWCWCYQMAAKHIFG